MTYVIKLTYDAPASLGADPVSGEPILEPNERRLVLSWSCPGTSALYKKTAISSVYLTHAVDPPQSWLQYEAQLEQPAPAYTTSRFGRGWDALSSSVLDWDRRVTWPMLAAASAAHDALAPVYAGAAQPVSLAIAYGARVASALMAKFAYLIMAVGVGERAVHPTAQCMSEMGLAARATGDALVESLPHALDFFLDVEMGQASESSEPVCGMNEHENFILAGSMKTYYFYSEECNARTSGGDALRCTLEDGILGRDHCQGFNLPYAGFNTNLLCAFDATLMTLVRQHVYVRRALVDSAEALAIEIIGCIAGEGSCTFEAFAAIVNGAELSLIGTYLCSVEELIIRVSGIAAALLSPGLSQAYALSGHPRVQKGVSSMGDDPSYLLHSHQSCSRIAANNATACSASIHCTPSNGRCVSLCSTMVNQATCSSQGVCSWLEDRCYPKDDLWMTYQSYPLEAAFATLLTSMLNMALFWPAYNLKAFVEIIQSVATMQTTTPGTCATCGLHDSRVVNQVGGGCPPLNPPL